MKVMSNRRPIGWLWSIIMGLVVLSLLLRLWNTFEINSMSGWPLIEEIVIWIILFPLAAPVFATVGAVILARRPGNLIAWLCITTSLIIVSQDLFWQYTLRAGAGDWPTVVPSALLTVWLSAPNIPPLPFTFLLLRFPDGHLLSTRWRWVEGLAVISAVAQGIAGTFYPQLRVGLEDPISNPLGIQAEETFLDLLGFGSFLFSLLLVGFAVIAMLLRRHRATGQTRQQLKWLAFTSEVLLVLLACAVGFAHIVPLGSLFYMAAVATGTIGIPVAIGIAMLRYRLYDVDWVINRAVVYGLLTALLVLLYVSSVAVLQGTFRLVTGHQSNLAVVTSSLIIAALFNPLRHRIQNEIDRRFYRRRYDAVQVLAAFSAIARDEVDLERLETRLLEVIAETMQPTHVSLWLRDGPARVIRS